MTNTDWTEKMNTFKALVLHDAEEKRSEMIEQTEKEYGKQIDKKENELLEKAYSDIQKNVHDTQKKSNERILHAELDAKRSLIMKREEIISEVINSARERLKEFTKSTEYEKWLTDKTEKAAKELGEGAKTVYISEDDMRFREKLEKLSGDISVEAAAGTGFIGGVKVTNTERRIAVDYTLDELLDGEKQKFLRESGLSLD